MRQAASARMMSGKRQDIGAVGNLRKQCEPIQEKGQEESMEDRMTDANFNKSSSRSNVDESSDNRQAGGYEKTDMQALVDYIGQIESRQDADSTTSQHDTSSVILNRIKLWPPQKSQSAAHDDSSQINAALSSTISNLNSINEESSLASHTLPSFGAGNSSTFNNQLEESIPLRTTIDGRDQVPPEESKEAAWFEKAYPFKADDFGQLVLPENVIKAKLVSLNNYGAMLPVTLMMSNRTRHQPTES